MEIDDDLLHLNFMSDSQRLKQVLVNLLSNALKFTYKGHIKISA